MSTSVGIGLAVLLVGLALWLVVAVVVMVCRDWADSSRERRRR